jgi:hypothetical protein
MNLILKKPLCFFDVEATGLQITTDRIVQIAIIKLTVDGEQEELNELINPEIIIADEIIAIHGISNEKVARIHAAAQQYGYDKPDAGERALKTYIAIKDKDGEAAADKWLTVASNVRDSVMGVKQRGPDKTLENKIKLDELIRKETEDIDRQLARPNLAPEKRTTLTTERKAREDRVRANYPELGGTTQDQQALEWANKNPTDPRAAAIKQRLGQ